MKKYIFKLALDLIVKFGKIALVLLMKLIKIFIYLIINYIVNNKSESDSIEHISSLFSERGDLSDFKWEYDYIFRELKEMNKYYKTLNIKSDPDEGWINLEFARYYSEGISEETGNNILEYIRGRIGDERMLKRLRIHHFYYPHLRNMASSAFLYFGWDIPSRSKAYV